MSKIITYREGAFCQIKLDSKERILISIAQEGIAIIKLKLGGIIPGKRIANWNITEIHEVINNFVDTSEPFLHPLDAIVRKILQCKSIKDIEELTNK